MPGARKTLSQKFSELISAINAKKTKAAVKIAESLKAKMVAIEAKKKKKGTRKPSAYADFVRTHFHEIAAEYPTLKSNEIMKILGKAWKGEDVSAKAIGVKPSKVAVKKAAKKIAKKVAAKKAAKKDGAKKKTVAKKTASKKTAAKKPRAKKAPVSLWF